MSRSHDVLNIFQSIQDKMNSFDDVKHLMKYRLAALTLTALLMHIR